MVVSLFCFVSFFYCFLAFLACSWFCICAILLVLNCDKLRLICLNGVVLVELLNSFDSGSAELTINTYFIVMVMITTRKAAKARFYRSASFLHSFKIVFLDKVNFNNLLTLSWLFYSLQMNSVSFLVTASILLYPVWSGKVSSV